MKKLDLVQMEGLQGGARCNGDTKLFVFGVVAGMALAASGVGTIAAGAVMTYCLF